MTQSSSPPGSGTTDRAPRILLVDDDVLILRTLSRLLRHARPDWQLVTASSAADALGLLKRTGIDVLITDMVMPGMQGAELVELVRSTYPNVACIIHSTRAHSVPMHIMTEAIAVLQKPVSMRVFLAAIEAALGRSGAGHDGNGTE
jgi:DNA-binding NtrC family response regulator